MSDNEIKHEAPERLVNWFAGPGYRVTLLVKRDDGAEMSDEDVDRLDASLAEYEKKDVPDRGPAFEPPPAGTPSGEEDES